MLAVLQNDASLMPCRLDQLRTLVSLESGPRPDALGAGYVQNGSALVRHRPTGAGGPVPDPLGLLDGVSATGVIVHYRHATVGAPKDENTHPFRYRSWLFAHSGTVAAFGDLRPALLERLPPFLQRSIAGETDSEHVFAHFLAGLRDRGLLELHQLPTDLLAETLAATVRAVEELAGQVGAPGRPSLNLVATNGQVLAACRSGDEPMWYARLGGLDACPRCHLPGDAPDTHPARMPHRNLRSLAVTTGIRETAADRWTPLQDRQVLAVGQDFEPYLRGVD